MDWAGMPGPRTKAINTEYCKTLTVRSQLSLRNLAHGSLGKKVEENGRRASKPPCFGGGLLRIWTPQGVNRAPIGCAIYQPPQKACTKVVATGGSMQSSMQLAVQKGIRAWHQVTHWGQRGLVPGRSHCPRHGIDGLALAVVGL